MTDTTALAIRRPAPLGGYQPPPDRSEFAAMIEMANNLAKAPGFVPEHFAGQPYKILAAILYGRDLGITPTNALQHIVVIDGKAGADAQLIGMLVRRAGHDLKDETTNEGSTVTITRGDTGTVYAATFSKADADRITIRTKDGFKKLSEQPAYKNYPRGMYYSRALTECARKGCQDALMGVAYTPEELDPAGTTPAQATGEIPLAQASAATVAALKEAAAVPSMEVPPPVATDGAGEQAVGAAASGEGAPINPAPATTPPPPPTAAVMPLSGPAFSRRMGVGRSVGPAPKRTNVVTPEPQGSGKPATAPEGAQQQVGPPEAIPAQPAPPDLVEEPVSATPVEDGLAPQRQLLRQAAAELAHVNAILFNKVTAPLENKELLPVPPTTPSDASDEGLARLVDRDFPGRTVANLDAAGLQNRLELVESNLAKKRALMAERGIAAE